jgi:hypothetical protein
VLLPITKELIEPTVAAADDEYRPFWLRLAPPLFGSVLGVSPGQKLLEGKREDRLGLT